MKMKFTTESMEKCSARVGILKEIERLPDLTFETPMLLINTRRGCIPHLCKDVFRMLTNEKTFLSTSLPSTILMDESAKEFDSFAEYVGMQEYPFFMSIQDPAEETQPGQRNQTTVAIWTRNGRCGVSADKYMDVIECFKPDIYVTLCDGEADINSTHKRLTKSVEKSKQFFNKCLDRHLQSSNLKNKGFLGAIEGGYNLLMREKCINNMENKAALLGYLIDGLHKNGLKTENISTIEIKQVIEHSLNLIPIDKLRVTMGCWNPSTLLDLVGLGIDVFDSSYPHLMAEQAKALTFLFDDYQHRDSIDLFEKRYMDDFEPISKSCTCLTCKNHTKGYIHHLIQTKELLSHVLIMLHNIHHYMEFFKAIRQHIKNGTFDEFRDKIQFRYTQKIKKS